jgi:hypothetical protein
LVHTALIVSHAKKNVKSLTSLLTLLTDLDCKTGNKVKAIDLTYLCKVAEKNLAEMMERVSTMIFERKSKKLIPPPLKINSSATVQTENSPKAMKSTAAFPGSKKTGPLPLSPINRNFSKNESTIKIVAPKQADGLASSKKASYNIF